MLSDDRQIFHKINRSWRKRQKVDASIFDSALSHTRRSDASEKKEKKIACPLLDVFACVQNFESSPVLVNKTMSKKMILVWDIFYISGNLYLDSKV